MPDDIELEYADESGFEEEYSRTYGYSPRGQRVYGEVHGTRFGRTSVVAALGKNNKIKAGFAFKGYMNSSLFEGWLENIYAPSVENPLKTILLIDNASHHRKDAVQDIADEYGFRVIFLPKYSPDFNKIEKTWANIKNWLRLHMQEYDSFWDALVRAFGCR